jgi:CelD/BcsL family acetyltransferase involved in cellulose biosynthesis
MRHDVLDPLTDRRWEDFVTAASGALVFHHPAWLQLVRDQYGYEIGAWVVLEGDRVVGGLPVARVQSRLTGTRLVAVPFCDLCGPIVADDASPEAGYELLATISAQRRRTGLFLEIHEQVAGLEGASSSQRFVHHIINLADDPAAVEAGFTKSQVRQGARKASRLGLRVERRTDARALDAFYRLHVATRRNQGVPVQPRRFIRRFTRLFERGLGHVALVVEDSGPPISAAVFMTFNGTLTYKYGASARTELRKRPNNLLFLDAIHWGCAQGLSRLDMGRTDLDNKGLRDFKLSWGAVEREVSYTWVSDGPPRRDGKAPPAIVGAVIRRSPSFVGRAVGELFYRHFA